MSRWMNVGDEELLVAARDDAEAFSAFYRRYEPSMLVFFRRRVKDAELAADLTAEVFAAVLGALGRYRPGGPPAQAWLFGIARNKLASSQRRGVVEANARQRLGMAPLELTDDDLEAIDHLGTEDVLKLLDDLPIDQRQVVHAHVIEERSYTDIAEQLRCSEAVVRKRVSRGLAQLRGQLGEESA